MNSINVSLKQLIILVNVSSLIPIFAIIVGFKLAGYSSSNQTISPTNDEVQQLSQLPDSLPDIPDAHSVQASIEPVTSTRFVVEPIAAPLILPYAVQAGVFSKQQLAVKLAKTLQESVPNIHVFIKHDTNNTTHYSVVVGLFESKDEAKEAGDNFTKHHNKPYYVTNTDYFDSEIDIANRSPILASLY